MATETHEGAIGACVDAGGSAIGMPQLCADWIPNQIFWLVVTLIVIYFVLSRVALPRIGAVLSERAGTITNDLGAAEELKQRAKAAEEIAARTAESEKAIAEIRDSAMASVMAVAKDTAGEIVRAMGGTDDQKAIDAAVDARIGGRA